MWPFRKRAGQPDLVAESDPVRHELLQSQLRDTLTYGWRDSGRDDAVEFFRSLPPPTTRRTSPSGWVATVRRAGRPAASCARRRRGNLRHEDREYDDTDVEADARGWIGALSRVGGRRRAPSPLRCEPIGGPEAECRQAAGRGIRANTGSGCRGRSAARVGEADVHVVLVVRVRDDDTAGPRGRSSSRRRRLGARGDEAVEEVLREMVVDLARRDRGAQAPVEPRVVDVDVEPFWCETCSSIRPPCARLMSPTTTRGASGCAAR